MRDPSDEPERVGDRATAGERMPEDDRNSAVTGRESARANHDSDPADSSSLPTDVVAAAERLTRLAREAVDENERDAYLERRDTRVADYEYTARVREEDDTLVCHPAEWIEDGTVRFDRIEDRSRAVEVSLSGPGDPDDWDELDAANRELVDAVREAHGPVHGANAAAFADFMGNHRARPITDATAADVEEFRTEYFVRNAWPSERQRELVDRSIERCFEVAAEPSPSKE